MRTNPPPHPVYMRLAGWAALALVILYLVAAIFPTQSDDIYMYLSIARRALAQGHVPLTDPFLYSLPGFDWNVWPEWGSHFFYYGLYCLGGWTAIVLAKALIVATIPAIICFFSYRKNYISVVTAVFLLACLIAGSSRFIERSSLFSDLFFLFCLAILLLEKKSPSKLKYALPVIFLLWVNLHPGFLAGIALCLFWVFSELITPPKDHPRISRSMQASLALSGAALFVNPIGWKGAIFPIHFVLFENAFMKKFFIEWLPTWSDQFSSSFSVLFFIILLAATVVLSCALWLSSRQKPLFEVLALGLIAYLGFSAFRFVPFSAYSLALLGVSLSSDLSKSKRSSKSAILVSAMVALGITVKILLFGYEALTGHRNFGTGIDAAIIPERAAHFVESLPMPYKLYNSHSFGCYLAWRWDGTPPLFVHGFVTQAEFYDQDFLGAQRTAEGFDRVVKKYGISVLLLDRTEGQMEQFVQAVQNQYHWRLLYQDDQAFVLASPST